MTKGLGLTAETQIKQNYNRAIFRNEDNQKGKQSQPEIPPAVQGSSWMGSSATLRPLPKRLKRIQGSDISAVESDSRLVSYEKNRYFGKEETLEPEFAMTVPQSKSYADVNSESKFPTTTELGKVTEYLTQHDKTLDEQIQRLYNEHYLKYFRMSPGNECVFIKSSCHAEMEKGVCYTVDIKFSNDGSVIEAQCECAAGMGPQAHCKHVCTVLYGAAM